MEVIVQAQVHTQELHKLKEQVLDKMEQITLMWHLPMEIKEEIVFQLVELIMDNQLPHKLLLREPVMGKVKQEGLSFQEVELLLLDTQEPMDLLKEGLQVQVQVM